MINGFGQTFKSLMDVYHNTNQAKAAVDALGQQMGMTKGQIDQLNGTLNQLAGEASTAAGHISGLQAQINALHGKSITVTTDLITNYFTSHSTIGPSQGGRAAGGPVEAGMAYTVGERGPELFFPNVPGNVMSNSDSQRFMTSPGGGHSANSGGGGGYDGAIHLNVTVPVQAHVDEGVLFQSIKRHTAIYAVRNGAPQQGRLAPGKPPS